MHTECTQGRSGKSIGIRRHTIGLSLAAGLMLAVLTANATTYRWKGDNGGSGYWTTTGTGSIWQGDPATYPVFDDEVVIATIGSTGNPDIRLDAGWSAGSISVVVTNSGGRRRILQEANGYVDTLTFSNSLQSIEVYPTTTGAFWFSGYNLLIREWHDVGPYQTWVGWNPNGWMRFTNDVAITYGASATNHFGAGLDFQQADSVTLRKNPNAVATQFEVITRYWGGNASPSIYIGRIDDGTQNWTVDTGSHPVLLSYGLRGIAKYGAGDVNMADVDLAYRMTTDNAGLVGGTGNPVGVRPLYGGTVRANSLTVDASPLTAAKQFVMGGHLLLDGEGGLEAGGSGNGRAVNLTTAAYDMTFRLSTAAATGNPALANAGRLEVTPAGGDLHVASTGAGKAVVNINAKTADASLPVVIANTLHLASGHALISDVNLDGNATGNTGATIELRGDFLSQCTLTNDFRMERSSLRVIGGGTNATQHVECQSLDIGAADPGTFNFAIGTVILGQTSAGATTNAYVALQDDHNNHAGDAGTEALYVESLQMYQSSVLGLNGCNLYIKNSGSWQQAMPGPFTYGDGTGEIVAEWPLPPPRGTVITIR